MDYARRRSIAEFSLLAAVLASVVIGFVVWTAILDDSDGPEESNDLVNEARATLTARSLAVEPTSTSTPAPIASSTPTAMPVASGLVCPADPFESELTAGVPFDALRYPDWYANEGQRLWASPLRIDAFLPPGFQQASGFWFANGQITVSWYGTNTPVVLTGEQIGGDAVIEPTEPAHLWNRIQWTEFTIPEPGCWTLAGTDGEETIEFTIEVLPVSARPDVILAQDFYAARPYEASGTCAISPWSGPDLRGAGATFAHYWLDDGGFEAEVPGLFVADRQLSMRVLAEDVEESLEITARTLDLASPQSVSATTTLSNAGSRLANFTFPSPGCWELEMTTPTLNATFVVYVYPIECEPILEEEEFIADCEAP